MRTPETWSSDERARVTSIQRVARARIGDTISVEIADDPRWPFNVAYGQGELTLNRAALGREWFAGPLTEPVLALVLHELGHHFASEAAKDGGRPAGWVA